MFTIAQIKQAHSKVQSGADFPAYIQEIKQFGVMYFETFVSNGRTDYYGSNEYKIAGPAEYPELTIADRCNIEQFKQGLQEHQQGKTNYLTFVEMCAEFGIEKWQMHIGKMTCTYFDKSGNEILKEQIPQ
ncbi:DUF1398 domain-containing protein [Albibacterium sp.]|uniref:DUF1398 domain-containing protein n=1 Tax=Albibacterium sp. TaxID=2952885 RepID=UPI002BC8485B|nr:DUF1398 family protein [Albibacterium sp.]HUH18427.1 DUF1398 family protein [Albibacterium sp.]